MGWLWSTPAADAPTASQAQVTPSSQSELKQSPQASAKAPTRGEQADQELQSFLQEIEADARPSSTKYNRIPRQSSSSNAPEADPSNEPLSEQLLPVTMSCRDAFDAAFYCNSLGGQFNNLYRYGTVGACSDKWDDFWFCMRTRTFGDREKQEAIRGRYREKEKLRYGRGEFGTSSEDVWKSRERKVELGTAFNTPFPDFEGTDEEWNRMERETRAKLQANSKA